MGRIRRASGPAPCSYCYINLFSNAKTWTWLDGYEAATLPMSSLASLPFKESNFNQTFEKVMMGEYNAIIPTRLSSNYIEDLSPPP